MGQITLSKTAQAAVNAVKKNDLDKLREIKKQEIKEGWEREINVIGMPVANEDFNVNFDTKDAGIWEEGLEIDKSDPIEVRGMDNKMHELTREKALTIPAAQKLYYAQQIRKKWKLQDSIDAATDIQSVLSVEWARGIPY